MRNSQLSATVTPPRLPTLLDLAQAATPFAEELNLEYDLGALSR